MKTVFEIIVYWTFFELLSLKKKTKDAVYSPKLVPKTQVRDEFMLKNYKFYYKYDCKQFCSLQPLKSNKKIYD